MIQVLVVDDSLFVRRAFSALLESDPEIKVVATGANGEEAIKLVHEYDPDVVTLDIEMPRMNGLEALKRIMAEKPCPVIMVSSLTEEGAEVTLKALEYGALDYFTKPKTSGRPDLSALKDEICAKVKALARRKAFMRLVHKNKQSRETAKKSAPMMQTSAVPALGAFPKRYNEKNKFQAVFIGVSTGGPPAVQKILSQLPKDFPAPVLIAQHMPATFTGPFANRLNAQCEIEVVEAEGTFRLKPGTAYVSPGGKHLRVEIRGGFLNGYVAEEPKAALYKPSADELMRSAGLTLGSKALTVMLTGMGSDGLEGTKVLKEKGGRVLAQSEKTCVVYGMPKAVVDAGLADEIVDIDDMANVILAHFNKANGSHL